MIPIVKPYLPPIDKYKRYLEGIYSRNYLTNRGPLVQELEKRLEDYLGVNNLVLVANGTLALQVAYRTLGLEQGEVLTTPYTFAASPGSLLWQNLQPRFVDIDPETLNLDATKLSQAVNQHTRAILPVHVFGNPCEVEEIEKIAAKHNVKVIYDAAHAFGSQLGNESVLRFGDAVTLSLHATKLFHCVEGGAIIFANPEDKQRAIALSNFGLSDQGIPEQVGINAKLSEVHAAMGLAVLDDISLITEKRCDIIARYRRNLAGVVTFQRWHPESKINGAYAPILLESEGQLLKVSEKLKENGVQSRRYFYPCLAEQPTYGDFQVLPNSHDLSARSLCLPLSYYMDNQQVDFVSELVKQAV